MGYAMQAACIKWCCLQLLTASPLDLFPSASCCFTVLVCRESAAPVQQPAPEQCVSGEQQFTDCKASAESTDARGASYAVIAGKDH